MKKPLQKLLLREVQGNEYSSRARVFEWFKSYQDGREDVEDDTHPGSVSTSKTIRIDKKWTNTE